MSDRLGPVALGHKEELVFLGREIGEQKNYSEKVAEAIDEEIRRFVTADSLAYLSEKGMYAALQDQGTRFCDACFTNRYPVPLGERPRGSQLPLFGEVER